MFKILNRDGDMLTSSPPVTLTVILLILRQEYFIRSSQVSSERDYDELVEGRVHYSYSQHPINRRVEPDWHAQMVT